MKPGDLFNKLKKDPKKTKDVVDKLCEEIDVSGTEEIEVPEELAFMFDVFEDAKDSSKPNEKVMEFLKTSSPKKIAAAMKKDGPKKTVKVNISKVKSDMKRGAKKVSEDADTKKNESVDDPNDFSLFSLMNESGGDAFAAMYAGMVAEAGAAAAGGFVGAVAVFTGVLYVAAFAFSIWCIYVQYVAMKNGEAGDIFAGDGKSTTGSTIGSILVRWFFGGIYSIILYIKLKKKGIIGKDKKMNESTDSDDECDEKKNGKKEDEEMEESVDDSIISMLEETSNVSPANPSTCFDKAHEPDHNGDLVDAYRIVLADLTNRVGSGLPIKD